MGTNNIPSRSDGQTILGDWFNQFRTALLGDLVPRDSQGVPTNKAGSIGNIDWQWSKGYFESLFVNNIPIDASLVQGKPHRISSGKAKSSGYPDFLTPVGNGNGLSCTLNAATTNLMMTINNIGVTIAQNLTFSSLSAAPSSNNTCVINDSSLSGLQSSKILGEYDNKQITITTIGTEISALNGKIAAFKVGTEVFLALIDTTNSRLLPILRGWAGTSRGTLTNSATITLLKLSTLLIKADGVTKVASTYYPESVSVAPAAATAGKVFFERSTNKVAYDNGSSIDYDYMILGYAVCDSGDCEWVQHWDFDLVWKENATVEYVIKNTTTLTVKARSIASVCGKDVPFYSDVDLTQASNMDTGEVINPDLDYNVYLKKDGTAVFSTVAPRRFNNFVQGLYHPNEYYRYIGYVRTNTSSEFSEKHEVGYTNKNFWGLEAPKTVQKNLIVSGTNWTTYRAVGIAYDDGAGNWRLKFNIAGNFSSPVGSFSVSIFGVKFKNVSNFYQAVAVAGDNTRARAYGIPNTDTVGGTFTDNTNAVYLSGDLELDSKPIAI